MNAIVKQRDEKTITIATLTAERDTYTQNLADGQADIAAEVAERDALNTEIARLAYQLRNSVQDSCCDDTSIRDALRPILGDAVVDGDANGVPPLGYVVEMVVKKYHATIAELREELAKRTRVRVSCHEVWIRERARREAAEQTITELREELALWQNAAGAK